MFLIGRSAFEKISDKLRGERDMLGGHDLYIHRKRSARTPPPK